MLSRTYGGLQVEVGRLAQRKSNAMGQWLNTYSEQCLPYRIPLHFPIAMTLFTNCNGTAMLRSSGPPPRARNFLKEHIVHE